MTAAVSFTGQNGAIVTSKPRLHVPGCGPGVSAKLRRARRARPLLSVKVQSHPDGGKLARFRLTLPKQLRAADGRRKVTVSSRKKDATAISAKLHVRLAAKARKRLRHGHKLKLRYKVVAVDRSGERFRVTATSRVR